RSRRGDPGRTLFAALVIAATVTGLILVALSPLALRSLAALRGFRWGELSSVGQTYSAVSALLVVLGLSGVAITVFLQVRESHHARIEAIRTRHYDLVRMAMEDPVYMQASRALSPLRTFDEKRQSMFINLEVQFWLMLWEFNEMSEYELRVFVADLLETRVGYRDWKHNGSDRTLNARSRRQRRFFQIINQEFEKSGAAKTELTSEKLMPFHNKAKRSPRGPFSLGLGLAALALGGSAIRRILRRLRTR
ncbi:MAG TPA: DUF6082 family protein, partial [Streptosporangiaceae bacterium]